jgi:hypothetical protein
VIPRQFQARVLQCAALGRLGLRAREKAGEDARHLALLGGPVLGWDEIDIEVAGKEIMQLAAWNHAVGGLADRMIMSQIVQAVTRQIEPTKSSIPEVEHDRRGSVSKPCPIGSPLVRFTRWPRRGLPQDRPAHGRAVSRGGAQH